MTQVGNFRSLARASASQGSSSGTPAAPAARAGSEYEDEHFLKVALHRFIAALVAIIEVSKTILRIFLLSLPVLGPIGLILWNMDFKGASQRASGGKSIAEQLGLANMANYAMGLFGKLDNLSTVANVAAGLATGKGGDLPEQKPGTAKGMFAMKPIKPGVQSAEDGGADDEPGSVDTGLKPADTKTMAKNAKPAKKLSPAMVETAEANDILAAFKAVEDDYRQFPQAEAALSGFLGHYPKSKHRVLLLQKFDAVGRYPRRAIPERATIEPDAKLVAAKISAREMQSATACLAGLQRINGAALMQKAVTIQSAIPAYVVLVDVTLPASVEGAPKSAAVDLDPGDRLALAKGVSGCFAKRMAAGSLTVAFWSDPATRQIGPALAQASDALVFVRG